MFKAEHPGTIPNSIQNMLPSAVQPSSMQPAMTQPNPMQPMMQPAMMQPNQVQSAMMQPNQMQPAMMQPNQMQSAMMQPNQMQPATMQPNQMQPAMMQPNQMQSAMMQPNQMQPNQVQSAMMQPNQMQPMMQPSTMPATEAAKYRSVFPEVYYKLMPYITMACDLMFPILAAIPSQQQVESVSDEIFDDFCAAFPDMKKYMSSENYNEQPNVPAINVINDPPSGRPYEPYDRRFDGHNDPPFRHDDFNRRRFRRRGLGRDFIDALLLSELLGRRRRGFFF